MPLWVAQEAYSQEVASAGFWPGSDDLPEPIFYAYAYPSPEGFAAADVGPDGACWSKDLGEFVLPLDAMRAAADPDAALLQFLNDSFDAAARLADWDMETLKRRHFPPGA